MDRKAPRPCHSGTHQASEIKVDGSESPRGCGEPDAQCFVGTHCVYRLCRYSDR